MWAQTAMHLTTHTLLFIPVKETESRDQSMYVHVAVTDIIL